MGCRFELGAVRFPGMLLRTNAVRLSFGSPWALSHLQEDRFYCNTGPFLLVFDILTGGSFLKKKKLKTFFSIIR